MASRLLAVPIALVSVVDADRQWFASARGLPQPWSAARQTPLTHSLCQYVVESGAPLILSDARRDPLVRSSLAISELGVIAYAGFPLRAPDSTVIGAFCAADTAPRQWTSGDLLSLDDLAAVAATEVANHINTARLKTNAARLHASRREADRQTAYLEALLECLDTAVAACDVNGRVVLFNRALRDAVDADADPSLEPHEWVGRVHVIYPDGRAVTAEDAPMMRARRGEHVRDVDTVLIRKDGRRVWFHNNATPIIDRHGELLGAVTAACDVTERRRAQRFQETELAVHRILAAATDAATAAPQVLQAVATTLDWAHAELWLSDGLTDLLHPIGVWTAPHDCPIHTPASITGGVGLAGTAWHTNAPVWVPDMIAAPAPLSPQTATNCGLRAALGVPVRAGGHAIGALTLFAATAETTDASCITLLAGIAAQIGEFLQRLRTQQLTLQLARSRDEYVALVGHELRTPLTSILAYTDFLAEADDDTPFAELRDLVTVVQQTGTAMRQTVDDLLDLASLDSGHAEVAHQPVDLAAMVRDCLTSLTPAAATQGVTVELRLPKTLIIAGSGERLRQLVDNLLGNAVKYSPTGGTVDVTLEHKDKIVQLTVADTGIGIPAEDRAHVFRRFHRSPQAVKHGIPGTGLGLALCATIVERHHGTITLVPTAGPGTTVVVRLPM